MQDKAFLMAETLLTLPVPLVRQDFISLTMPAPMFARHGPIAPVLLVNISPALLQPTALAHPVVLMNIPAVALQQSVRPRPDPLLAHLVKDLPMEEIAQTIAVLYVPLEPQN